MSCGYLMLVLVFLLVEYTDSAHAAAYSKAHCYITPSLSVHCPGDPCLTLAEIATNSTGYIGNETNISLSFLPGNHSLDGELSLSHADNFSMTKVIGGNGTVFIECGNLSGRFNISETTFATIKDLHFVGCGGNRVSQVEQFIVEDTIFEGVEGRGTALVLNEVSAVSIAKSYFISNTHDNKFEQHGISSLSSSQDKLNYLFLERNASFAVGGAMYVAFSNVSIVSSKFAHNAAEIGGVILAEKSSLYVIRSEFYDNSASFGGGMITSESIVLIDASSFSEHTAEISGGMMVAYKGSFFISGTLFNNNSAGINSGVMETYNIAIDIIDSSFSNNKASDYCGVICAINSTFRVTKSTFTSNRATADDGGSGVMAAFRSSFIINCSTFADNSATFNGVMNIVDGSTFDLVNCTFISNRAILYAGVMAVLGTSSVSTTSSTFTNNSANAGGVMRTYSESSVSIVNSTFSNNSANSGGVVRTHESLFNITDSTFIDNAATTGGVMRVLDSSFIIVGCTFISNFALNGGVMQIYSQSSFTIIRSTFIRNVALLFGGIMTVSGESSSNITDDSFIDNQAGIGGVLYSSDRSSFSITTSTFANNSATHGGVMRTHDESLYKIISCIFMNNRAYYSGGVMRTSGKSSFGIENSTFTKNRANGHGGVLNTDSKSSFNICSSVFTHNSAIFHNGGVMSVYAAGSSLTITRSVFSNNVASFGGVIGLYNASFDINSSTFSNNIALRGGVMHCSLYDTSAHFSVTNSAFRDNSAIQAGGVLILYGESLSAIINNTFTNNSATDYGGVIHCSSGSFNIDNSSFNLNKADNYGGIMFTIGCSIHIANSVFEHNKGSLYIFNSNLTFSGYTSFENCIEPSNKSAANAVSEGGAITSFQSTTTFIGVSSLCNNQARHGGAILATESKIIVYKWLNSETIIANNTATASSGGGISLHQSEFEVRGNCIISGNDAERGGGIHATSSTVAVYQPGSLHLINNRADIGGGLYFEGSPKLYILKSQALEPEASHYFATKLIDNVLSLIFSGNHANYEGGAIYVADDTNSGACSSDNECFIQILALYQQQFVKSLFELVTISIDFSNNTATEKGANIFGGLLDRCIPSPFAEVYLNKRTYYYSGTTYLRNISSITFLDTISSLPVRVCFCKNDTEIEADCGYQPPTIKVKKGEAFTVPLVAVDQVNHSVDANIISSLSSQDGGFSEGQHTQSVGRNCSNVTFNVFSPHNSERMSIFAEGPCGSSSPSIRHLTVQFKGCTCPIGFEPSSGDMKSTRCDCVCDSELFPYITNCNLTTESLMRIGTNSWITFNNDTDPTGYIIHPNCPFDYCYPPTKYVSINFNLQNGEDAQCAYNRSGVLCGGCQEQFSLSLGSSRCLSCHSHWPAVLVVIFLAAIVAGILLVTALLALNMTVAVGLINGFIFYANIISANSAIFFPSSEPTFPTVFVAWLNLDIGIDVCFFDGLDAYSKTWLQLAFPVYIISLVIIVIIVSEYSPRFAGLIGKKDPIATLATLILLSYAKLLSVTITALSFAVLEYPDGSQETVWLPDGNVPYFRGKHVALVLIALLIILVGVPYTILLFLWQWLVRAPEWKVFKWTRNTKLNAFISVHHAPYNSQHRYRTGLLLFLRVFLFTIASVTVSDNPQISLLVTNTVIGGLFLLREMIGLRIYKKSIINVIETGMYFNLLVFAVCTMYNFKIDLGKQKAVAYTSTIVTFILLVGVIIYHVYLLVRKDHPQLGEEVNEYPLAPVQPGKDEVTYSVIEIPKPRDQSPPPENNSNEAQGIQEKDCCYNTPPYR